jgi:RNA polymerase sigma factor, sigma-70 family
LKTFPPPLTVEEEKLYLQKYKEGDLEAKKVLIERNLRLVAHVAKKYQGLDDESEDLISIGTIGLIKAVSTFDNSKGNRLATYAARCIDNELLMMLRTKKKTSKEVSLHLPIGMDKEGNTISLEDILVADSTDVVEALTFKSDVHKVYRIMTQVLSDREKEVILLRYGLLNMKGITQRELAAQLGISRSYVSRIEKRALEKLKECFKECL